MAITYIEAFERIQTGAGDRRILLYELNDNVRHSRHERVVDRYEHQVVARSASMVNEDWKNRRINELKSVLQRSHPDKPSGDAAAFRSAKDELEKLRKCL